ncbi:hypothetical protein Patl1_19948 [Pistacia atlantica]|uniref:Uncharacterized protein n=1 Tax=Pistacia atlantica TaxID=434234 RepID=A0ACC1BHW1_9ROSI|nr:hypothetical protein Patl1_19948 [Pistacia atlantica]
MSILWEKTETWWWIVRKTGDSKPFFFAFDTICGVVPDVIGYCVMQLTNSRNPQLEAQLRQTARFPFSCLELEKIQRERKALALEVQIERHREISIRGSDSNVNSIYGCMSRQASTSGTVSGSGSCNEDQRKKRKKGNGIKNKYSFIPDNFKTLQEVIATLREEGLESSNLILGIDFTKSNEWNGPTSYAPVIEAAIDIVEKSGRQYHVLAIVADSQVTRSVGTCARELTPKEQKTIQSIVSARSYPLSIILVRVGDGSWVDMKKFDDKIPAREFDNFHPEEKEATFALAALMKIPFQHRATIEFSLLMRTIGREPKIVPRPPPVPYSCVPPEHVVGVIAQACPICLTSTKDLAFSCGHMNSDLQRPWVKSNKLSHMPPEDHRPPEGVYLMADPSNTSTACIIRVRFERKQRAFRF